MVWAEIMSQTAKALPMRQYGHECNMDR